MNIDECRLETAKHIERVGFYINSIIHELLNRGAYHDKSKLLSPEVEIFAEYTPKLATSAYGSEEYKGYLKEMGVALKNHYRMNRHHPEHFRNGILGMNIVDITEMLCDWKAATLRHNDGDLLKSIELNQKRFGYSDDLKTIFLNTAKTLYKYCIEYGCTDGREETFLGDTVEQVYKKIEESKLLDKTEKSILKIGYFHEFKDGDYVTKEYTIDNGFWCSWTANH